jgi:hypothetical protein
MECVTSLLRQEWIVELVFGSIGGICLLVYESLTVHIWIEKRERKKEKETRGKAAIDLVILSLSLISLSLLSLLSLSSSLFVLFFYFIK